MKKCIPYIAILLISYLVVAFVKMQFNPQYWTMYNRVEMIGFAVCIMSIYPIIKFIINDMKK